MKNPIIAAALAGAISGGAILAAAPALADPTTDDVHCLIVNINIMGAQDQALQMAGTMGHLYYLGKLYGRAPTLDLESLLLAEFPKMTPPILQAEAERCGDEMKARAAAEAAMGQDIEKKDIPAPPAPPTPPPADAK